MDNDNDIVEFNIYEHIIEILCFIDFNKIYKIMKTLKWSWANADDTDKMGIPTISSIKRVLSSMILDTYKNAYNSKALRSTTACGGFEVIVDIKENYVDAKFVIEGFSTCFE